MNLRPLFSLCVTIVIALGTASGLSLSACPDQHSGRLQTGAPVAFFGVMPREIRDLDRPLHGGRLDQVPQLQFPREREMADR